MNDFVRIAQATNTANSGANGGGGDTPLPIVLSQPTADQSVVTLRAPGQLVDFRQIVNEDISFIRIDGDLQMIFADGGIIIVQGFFTGEDASQIAIVGDEQTLSVDQFVSVANLQVADQIQTAAGETSNLATALGGPQGSGQNFQETQIGALGDGLGVTGLLNGDGPGQGGGPIREFIDGEVDTVPFVVSAADAGALDEGNLSEGNEAGEGSLVAIGSLGINFGENAGPTPTLTFNLDGAGVPLDSSGSPLDLSSDGVALTYTVVNNSDGGQTLTATKEGTSEVVFTVTLDIVPNVFDGGASGANYIFTLEGNLDHLGTEFDTELPVSFGITATDTDGDSIGTTFVVTVADDDAEIGSSESSSVDEEGLAGGNVDSGYDGDLAGSALTSTGDLAISWGSDNANPTSGGGTGDRSVAFSDAQPGLTGLTSNGDDVSIEILSDGTLVGYTGDTVPTATDSAGVVFFATLSDAGNGSYAFTLTDNLDHPEADTEDDVDLVFAYTATDGDGDTASSTFTVTVNDDALVIGEAAATSVDEEGLGGNAGDTYASGDLDGEAVTASGSLAISWGADDANSSVNAGASTGNGDRAVVFSNTAVTTLTALGLTSRGEDISYEVSADGATLTAFVGDRVVFTAVLSDEANGTYEFTQSDVLDHATAGSEDDVVLTFDFTATDSDGDTASSTFQVTVNDDAPVLEDVSFSQVDEDGLDGGNVGESYPGNEGDYATGGARDDATTSSRSLNISWGADDANSDENGGASSGNGDRSVEFTSADVFVSRGSNELSALTSRGEDVVFRLEDNDAKLVGFVVSSAFSGGAERVVLEVTLSDLDNGSYDFAILDVLDHQGSGKEDNIRLTFDFTATDSDGDSVDGSFAVRVDDDAPVLEDVSFSQVDEDGLDGGNVGESYPGNEGDYATGGARDDATTSSRSLNISWGADDANSDENGGASSGNGDRSVEFTSADVFVSRGSNELSALTSRGEDVVFRLEDNDAKLVGFVVSSAFSGGAERVVLEVTLSDLDNGSYDFAILDVLDHQGSGKEDNIRLTFDFTATDSDGDSVDGSFAVRVDDDAPVINQAAIVSGEVDEEGLNRRNKNTDQGETGDIDGEETTASGALGISFGADDADINDAGGVQDVPGGNGNRSVVFAPIADQAELAGLGLTSNDQTVFFVLINNDTTLVAYTGDTAPDATDADNVVFHVSLSDDDSAGRYDFTLVDNLDHDPNAADVEDNIDLVFQFVATDSDGDQASADFTVSVNDDAPVIGNARNSKVDEDLLAENVDSGYRGDIVGAEATASKSLKISWGADDNVRAEEAGDDFGRSVAFIKFGDTSADPALLSAGTEYSWTDLGLPSALTSDGVTLVYDIVQTLAPNGTWDGGYQLIAYKTGGDVNDVADQVFTLTLDVTTTEQGTYTFDLVGNLDHEIANREDNIDLHFSFRATDADGDTSDAETFRVRVDDDAPVIGEAGDGVVEEEHRQVAGPGNEDTGPDGLDEDYRNSASDKDFGLTTHVAKGGLAISWGADDADDTDGIDNADTANRSVNFDRNTVRDLENQNLTSDGENISYTIRIDANGEILIAYTGDEAPDEIPGSLRDARDANIVFMVRMSDNDTDDYEGSGSYEFTLVNTLDHQGDIQGEDIQSLTFNYVATDSDGDTAESSFQIDVIDDAPRVGNARGSTVDEDLLDGGNVDTGYLGDVLATDTTASRSLRIQWGADDDVRAEEAGDDFGRSVAFIQFGDSSADPALLSAGTEYSWTDLGLPSELTSDGVTLVYDIVQTLAPNGTWDGGYQLIAYKTGGDVSDVADQVFTLTLDATTDHGTYTFDLVGNLDHDVANREDNIDLRFSFRAIDADGDISESESFRIRVDDDAPVAFDVVAADQTDDEGKGDFAAISNAGAAAPSADFDDTDGQVSGASGTLFNAGADGVRSVTVDVFPAISAIHDTGGIAAVEAVSWSAGITGTGETVWTATGDDSGDTVATLTIGNDGSYTFVQSAALAHGSDDATESDDLDLTFEFTVEDGDGDTASGSLTVSVDDDTPDFSNPGGVAPGVSNAVVDEDDIVAVPGVQQAGTDGSQAPSTAGTLKVSFGADGFGSTAFSGFFDVPNENSGTVVAGGVGADSGLTSDGDAVFFRVSADGQTLEGYVPDRADEVVFQATLNDSDAGYAVDLLGNIDHEFGSDTGRGAGQSINLTVVATDGDGDTLDLTLSVRINDDAPDARWWNSHIEADEASPIGTIVSGELQFVPGADGASVTAATVRSAGDFVRRFDQEEAPGSQAGNLLVGGARVTSTATTDPVTGVITIDGVVEGTGVPAFQIIVQPDGNYTYEQLVAFDHPDADETGADDKVALLIDFTVTDGDGDTDTAGAYIRVADDGPVVTNPGGVAPGVSNAIVDEDDIVAVAGVQPTGTDGSKVPTATGTLKVDFGADGFGSTAFSGFFDVPNENSGTLTPGDNTGLDSGLTSDGDAVFFRVSADGQTLEGYVPDRADEVVFQATLNDSDAGYTVDLLGNIDHEFGSDTGRGAGQSINLTVVATDGDDDTLDLTLSVRIFDDAPVVDEIVTATIDEDDIVTFDSVGNGPFDGDGDGSTTGPFDFRFGPAIASGSINNAVNFGADGAAEAGAFAFAANAAATMVALGLSSKGEALSFDVVSSGGFSLLVGYVDDGDGSFDLFADRPVIGLVIDESGNYAVLLNDQLDHMTGNGDDAELVAGAGSLDEIDFGAVIEATDGDGDTINLSGQFLVSVTDDVPDPDMWLDETVRVDETHGEHSDNDFDDATGTYDAEVVALFSGVTNPGGDSDLPEGPIYAGDDVVEYRTYVGADERGQRTLELRIDDTDSELFTTENEAITLTLEDGLVVGRTASGNAVFAIHIDGSGRVSIVQYQSLKHPNTNSSDEYIDLAGKISAVLTVTDADGDAVSADISIGADVTFDDDGPIAYRQGSSTNLDEADDLNALISGQLQFDGGADDATVTNVDLIANGAHVRGIDLDASGAARRGDLSVDGSPVTWSSSTDPSGVITVLGVLEGTSTQAFEIIVNPDGSYTYQQFVSFDHPDADETGNDDRLAIRMRFTIADGDGDTDTAGAFIRINDDGPDAEDVTASMEENTTTVISLVEGTGPDLEAGEDYITGADGGALNTITLGTPAYSNVPAGVTVGTPGIGLVQTATGYDVTVTPGTAFDNLAVGESLLMTIPYTVEDGDGDTYSKDIEVTVTGSNDAPEITGGDTTGAVVESGDVVGIVEADVSGNLEPSVALNPTIDAALNGLLTDPSQVESVLATVQSELGGTEAQAIAVVWDFLDDNYTAAPGGTVVVNEAFVRLGVEYAEYLKAGGAPLMQTIAKFTPDGVDAGDTADRLQMLHDNLLGNLNSAPLSYRFADPLLSELQALISSVDAELMNRPIFSGNESADDTATRQWDVDNGFDAPRFSGQLTATDVDNGASLSWSIDGSSPATQYGSFSIDPVTGEWTYTLDDSLAATQGLEEGETATETFVAKVMDEHGATDTVAVTVTVTGSNDAPEITGGDTTGAVVESGDVVGIVEADVSGNLEPSVALNPTIDAALNGLLTDPSQVESVLATVQSELGGTEAQAIAVVWDFFDDNYTAAPGGTVVVNEAFVRLGVEYAEYLKAGGAPLMQTIAKFTPDSVDAGDVADRLQMLHDNLLGNLNSAPLSYRFADPLLSELQALISSVDAELMNRPIFSGNESADDTATRQWDVDNGFDAPRFSGQLTATDVDNGASLSWSIDGSSPATQYGSFSIDPATGEWTYTLDDSLAATQGLEEGETATETFVAKVTDEHGATDTISVTVTVTGSNDAPSDLDFTGSTIAAGASVGTVVGDVTVTDVDDDTFTFEITDPDGMAVPGLSVVSDGAGGYQMVVDGPVTMLPAEITITVSDPDGASYSEAYVVTLPVQLFDGGGVLIASFSTVQAAVDASAARGFDTDVIEVGAGTYVEDVTIGHAVEVRGPNTGTPGDDAGRMAEAVIQGEIVITAATGSVVLDGLEVSNTSDNSTSFNGVTVSGGAGVTIENSVFSSTGENGATADRAIYLQTGATGAIVITGNAFGGDATGKYGDANWTSGIWSDGQSVSLSVMNNGFDAVRTAMNLDSYDDTASSISGNTIANSGSGISIGLGSDSTITGITGNEFDNVDTDFNLGNLTTDITFDAGTTGNESADPTDPMYIIGGTGNDDVKGTDGVDFFAGGAGSGDDRFEGRSGNDGIAGGDGDDTSVYQQAITTDMLTPVDDIDPVTAGTQPGWTIATGGAEGTDALLDVEIIEHAGSKILLVGNGGFDTIQDAVDAAQAGDTILIAPGTWSGAGNENITIDKPVTIEGAGAVVIDATGSAYGFNIDLDTDYGSGTVRFENITVENADSIGINATDSDILGSLELENVSVSGSGHSGLHVSGRTDTSSQPNGGFAQGGVQAVVVSNSSFDGNGTGGANGSGDIVLFEFDGDATFSGVTITGTTPGGAANTAIQIAGFDASGFQSTLETSATYSYDVLTPMGTVIFEDVSITGDYSKLGLYIQGFTDTTGLQFRESTSTPGAPGTTIDVTAGWSVGLGIDPMADQLPTGTPGTPGNAGSFFNEANANGSVDLTYISVADAGGIVTTFVDGTTKAETIIGTSGSDSITGFEGDDTINSGDGDDIVTWRIGDGNDTVDGGGDTGTVGDTLRVVNGTGAAQTITLDAPGVTGFEVSVGSEIVQVENVEEVNLTLSGAGDTVDITGDFIASGVNTSTITVDGGEGNDTVDASQMVRSGEDSNVGVDFFGNGGNDEFVSGVGDDYFEGGDDTDTYKADGPAGNFEITIAADGTITITDTVGDNGTDIAHVSVEFLQFDGKLFDLTLPVHLFDENDHLVDTYATLQAAHADALDGYRINLAGTVTGQNLTVTKDDLRIEGQSDDTGNTFTLGGGVTTLTLLGDAPFDVVGNGLANVITGNAGDNRIVGGDNNDTVDGGEGSDTYEVGYNDGFDTYQDTGTGGSDVDTIKATHTNAVIGVDGDFSKVASGIEVIEGIAGGNNRVLGDDNANTLDFSGMTVTDAKLDGGKGNDTITGTDGADIIVGGDNNDTVDGGDGSDTYEVGYNDGFDTYQDTGTGASDVDTIKATHTNAVIGVDGDFSKVASGIEVIEGIAGGNNRVLGDDNANTLDFSGMTVTDAKLDGGKGNDTITGTDGADIIVGGDNNDTVDGGEGSDTYEVGYNDGFDTYQDTGTGGSDVDTIKATHTNAVIGVDGDFSKIASGIEVIEGIAGGNNRVLGDDNANTLDFSGMTVTDAKLDGGKGNDTITGTDGADIIVGGDNNDIVDGGEGSDTYEVGYNDGFDTYQDTGTGGSDVDTIKATHTNAVIGVDGDFSKIASGIEVIEGIAGGNNRVLGDDNANTLDFSGMTVTDAKLDGGKGNDTITGTDGADIIVGGDNNDTVDGGEGSDTYEVGYNDGFDTYQDTGTGASDVDTIKATHTNAVIGVDGDFSKATSGIEVIDADGGSNVRVLGTSATNNLNFSDVQLINGVRVDAAAGDDTVTTSQVTSDNVFYKGGSGVDTLRIALTLDQAADATLIAQIDAFVPGAGINGIVNAGGLSFSAEGFENIVKGVVVGDSFLPFDNVLIGTPANDVLDVESHVGVPTNESYLILGRSGSDVINGSNGDDIIVGEGGNDTLNGGDGNDTFLIGSGDGVDTFDGGNGTDTIRASEDNVAIGINTHFAAGAAEEISSGGFNNVSVCGDNSNNNLDFSQTTLSGITEIDGEGGHDTITGSADADTIIGGTGNDTLNGGDGNDTFLIGSGDGVDTFDGGNGTDTIRASEDNVAIGINTHFVAGAAEVISSGGFNNVSVRGDNSNNNLDFSQTTLSGITEIDGEGGHDTITGSADADTIIGGTGNDTLNGGDGNDTFLIGSGDGVDTFDGGNGTDTIRASEDNVAIGINTHFAAGAAEVISSGGFNNVSVRGDNSNNNLDFSQTTLSGITEIDGEGGHDTITGSAAADTIIGGTGNDTLNGGDGNDTFLVGSGDGVDTFDGGNGTDTIRASEDNVAIGINTHFVAGAAEVISSGGFNNVSVRGDNSNNNLDFSQTTLSGITEIDGEGGHDTITGSAAADTILGGTGNDTINAGAGDDTVKWSVGDGRDVIDGGAENTIGDTFSATGDGTAEAYGIYSLAEAAAQLSYSGSAEIVITRNGTIIAELTEIEEIVIDGAGGGDTFTTYGSFAGTNLSTSTITVKGTSSDDTVDVTELQSGHRVVFHANGGNDRVLNARSQDLVDVTDQTITNVEDLGGGEYRVEFDGGATVTFTGTPTFVEHADTGEQVTVNLPPIAEDDAVSGDEDHAGGVTGNVLNDNGSGADNDLDGGSLSVVAETKATANGTVTILATGEFTYTPNTDYNGTDTFEYTVIDGQGGSDTATVTVTVDPVNDAPEITGIANTSVAENSAGVLLDTFTVTDVDTASGLTFRVLDGSSAIDARFEVVAAAGTTQGEPGTYELRLKPGEGFDYETENADGDPTIGVTVEVNDGNSVNNLTTIPITVTVTDVNEGSSLSSLTLIEIGANLTSTNSEGLAQIASPLSNPYVFSYDGSDDASGSNGGYIYDGGRDMYDWGNYIHTNHNNSGDVYSYGPQSAPYTNGSVVNGAGHFGAGSSYATFEFSGAFVLAASNVSITDFIVNGNLGADGYGSVNSGNLTFDVYGTSYTVFYKTVWDGYYGADATVNQLVIVEGDGTGITQSVSSYTNSGYQSVSGLGTISELYYVLASEAATTSHMTNAEIEAVAREFVLNAQGKTSTSDPIALDLNGDGVDLSATTSFDIDADGDKDQIGWTGPEDGLLAVDLDGSGAIEDGSELFSEVFNGGSYANSLEALASLDDNGDGVIDAQDAAYSEIKVWQDANSDGITQDGELQSLIERGIEAINLEAAAVNQTVDGNTVFAEGTYTKDDGGTGTYVGVTFGAANDDSDDTTRQSAALAAGVALVLYAASAEEVAAGLTSVSVGKAPLHGEVNVADDLTVTYTSIAGYKGTDAVELELTFADGSIVTRSLELEVLADDAVVTGSSTVSDTGAAGTDEDDPANAGNDDAQASSIEVTAMVTGSVITGDDGNNILVGTDGDDILAGGLGSDILTGGAGADTFVLNSLAEADIITDYNFGEGDKVDLGSLLDAAFKSGEIAGDLVRATENADGSVKVEVDQDGSGAGHDWQEAAVLQDHASMGDTVRVVMDNDDTEVNVAVG